MLRPFEANRYSGTGAWPRFAAAMMPAPAGHCRRCGEPSGACRCGCRECRREAKELLVEPTAETGGNTGASAAKLDTLSTAMMARMQPTAAGTDALRVTAAVGTGESFIGGGCCVSLSVEYAPSSATVAFAVVVEVADSEGTTMLWARQESAGTPYRIKECVITTKPGAKLTVITLNCTARVRWCEIFSCGC